ncbi:MAG: sigma-70 family RNA polymerase sigma factor [Burkholderiaceae bacterium]|nr:sigma-70 family RNA polymerase sigma factor [Burkholderiaceae bacterium]
MVDGAASAASRQACAEVLAEVWHRESALLVALVARWVRDLGLAEDLVQDALEAALQHWPLDGIPERPGAWLLTTARRRALDRLRRDASLAAKLEQIGADLVAQEALIVPDFVDALDAARADVIGDDLLRLIFTACHPLLSADAREALTLKILAGLSTEEIARAFLVSEATVAQRIVRAKRTLAEAGVPFELPRPEALAERLDSVLEVVYLIFNAGYTALRGAQWMRGELTHEAQRLARLLAGLMPQAPEVHGLAALLDLQASRSAARLDDQGAPVLLLDQDRSRWDAPLIGQGLQSLARAEALLAAAAVPAGPYVLQAAIAACHARAATAEATDWAHIARLYGRLLRVQPTPVVALNRAVAVGMADGPAAGLALVDGLVGEPALRDYPWLHSVRGDLLQRLQRRDEAIAAFGQALALSHNGHDRWLLQRRLQQLQQPGG